MNATNTALLANLRALQEAERAVLRAMDLAAQDGTTGDWLAAHAAAKPHCVAVSVEIQRLTVAGFDEADFERAVLGRLQRRYERSSMTTQEVRAALYGA